MSSGPHAQVRSFRWREVLITIMLAVVLCGVLAALAWGSGTWPHAQGIGATPTSYPTDLSNVSPSASPSPQPSASPSVSAQPPPPPPPSPPPPPGVDCAIQACVALTFDDGPGPDTSRLLDILAQTHTPATFFVLGGPAAGHQDIIARQVTEGHVVAIHGWSHRPFTKISDAEMTSEIERTREVILHATGGQAQGSLGLSMVRPPYGATNDRILGLLGSVGDSAILWNVDSEDWRNKNTAVTTQRILDTTKPGSIILMHDIHPWSVDAVPGVIAELRARGMTLVTVPELVGGQLSPGIRIYGR